MRLSSPVIGINTDICAIDSSRSNACTRTTYIDAVAKAGGLAVLLPAMDDLHTVREYVRLCDGFVFIGGGDIDPRRYGKPPHPTESPLAERRENFDFALIHEVIQERKPFLAICLGAQEINVALGGALIQDIASEATAPLPHYSRQGLSAPPHKVHIVGGSTLHNIVGTTELVTNTSHHQAIKTPGKDLEIVARAEDRVIEACELRDYPFGLCIQWHPEAMTDNPAHLALFKALIKAAKNKN